MRMFRNPVRLNEIKKAESLLLEIKAILQSKGLGNAVFNKHGDSELIEFDILNGLSVHNHGRTQSGIRCIACPVHPHLQYEFIIEDLEGRIHRPIGSTCILKRALGEYEAEQLGKRMRQAARSYFNAKRQLAPPAPRTTEQRISDSHASQQRRLLKESGNARAYLTTLGFDWLIMAEITGDSHVIVTKEDRRVVRGILQNNQILSIQDLSRFNQLHQDREAAIREGRTVATDAEALRISIAATPDRIPARLGYTPPKPQPKKALNNELKARPRQITEAEGVALAVKILRRQLRESGYEAALAYLNDQEDVCEWTAQQLQSVVTKCRRYEVKRLPENELKLVAEKIRKAMSAEGTVL